MIHKIIIGFIQGLYLSPDLNGITLFLDMDRCTLCNKSISNEEPTVKLGEKGCGGKCKASEARGEAHHISAGQIVHVACRHDHVNPNIIASHTREHPGVGVQESEPHCTLRSAKPSYTYKTNCLFCGCPDIYDGQKPEYKLKHVTSTEFQESILQVCNEIENHWVDTARARIVYVHNLCSRRSLSQTV